MSDNSLVPSIPAANPAANPAATPAAAPAATPAADTAPAAIVRRACAEDAASFLVFMLGLSALSTRQRFRGAAVAPMSMSMATQLCTVDGARHQAWLAWGSHGDSVAVVGEARFEVSVCGRNAKLAIAVADDWQGRGVGRALMNELLTAARAAGVSDLHGEVLNDNLRMQAFMRRHGFDIDTFEGGNAVRMTRILGAHSLNAHSLNAHSPSPTAARPMGWLRSTLADFSTRRMRPARTHAD